MGLNVSYMGTKKHLASIVVGAINDLPPGPVLDAFSGMGAVCEALSTERNVWVNDCQPFASNVSRALFTSKQSPPETTVVNSILRTPFSKNMKALKKRFSESLLAENRYFSSGKFADVLKGNTGLPHVGSCEDLEKLRKRLSKKPTTFPYRMATITYCGAYFGVLQCFEIDSLVYAIDTAARDRSISAETKRWLMLALCQVASRVNNSTGHFAQFIKPKPQNVGRIVSKRKRSVYNEFFSTLDNLGPIGTREWRKDNKAFMKDTLKLLPQLKRRMNTPTVIYADPPYTGAEYPRYYHVLDMILEYRYPTATGAGRYPDGRISPAFSRKRTVASAMNELVSSASGLGASLVLSYPGNGLLQQIDIVPKELLLEHYRKVEIAYSHDHGHSTFGGPYAEPTIQAREHVYVSTDPY